MKQNFEDINNAFFRFERFTKGQVEYYKYFGFKKAFDKLFIDSKLYKNWTIDNAKLIDLYYTLCSQIAYDFDKGCFDNDEVYLNEDFCNDCEEISSVCWHDIEKFVEFGTEDEPEDKPSILDQFNIDLIKKQPPKLFHNKVNQRQTDLTTEQRGRLFDMLADKEFIITSPDAKKNFVWALGKVEEEQPSNWKPIEWTGKKNLLAYFVDVFNVEILGNERIEWLPFEKIFNQNGLNGAKNDYQKIGTLPQKSKLIDTIINEIMK